MLIGTMPVKLINNLRCKLISIVCCFVFLLHNLAYADGDTSSCIAANDFGLGGSLNILANPDEGSTDSTKTKLVKSVPKNHQIAPWIDMQMYTIGTSLSGTGTLVGSVAGSWIPWSVKDSSYLPECKMLPCDKSKSKDAVCLNDGQIVDDSIANAPCIVSGGAGLYGLIALLNNGSYQDPNELGNATSLPPEYFRTFHAYPLIQGPVLKGPTDDDPNQPVVYEYHFEIDKTQVCDDQSVCTIDQGPDGTPGVARGRLFFKILDRYYPDNSGGYDINMVSGVYTDKGFIETRVEMFEGVIKIATQKLYTSLSKDTNFINILQAMLVLYVVFTGVGFMLGVITAHQSEIVTRLFKASLIATIISQSSWDFFNDYLFGFFTDFTKSIGSLIIQASLFQSDGTPLYTLPQGATPLAVYDVLLRMITKPPIHIKIVSLLFYDWKLYWIPCIYICIVLILWAMLQSVILYLLVTIQVALLFVIAPIFLIMMLFKVTAELFDTWLKQLISASMLYIFIAASIAIMMQLIVAQITSLLSYRVCWQTIWELKILTLTIWDMKFWYPQSDTDVLNSVTALNFFAFLLICFLFKSFIDQLPGFADMLSNAVRTPMAYMYRNAMQTYGQSFVGSIPGRLGALNPIGLLVDRQGSVGRGVLGGIDAVSGAINKADRALGPEDMERSVKTGVIGDYDTWLPKDSGNNNSTSGNTSGDNKNKKVTDNIAADKTKKVDLDRLDANREDADQQSVSEDDDEDDNRSR